MKIATNRVCLLRTRVALYLVIKMVHARLTQRSHFIKRGAQGASGAPIFRNNAWLHSKTTCFTFEESISFNR